MQNIFSQRRFGAISICSSRQRRIFLQTIDSSPPHILVCCEASPDRYLQPVANPVIEGARTRNGTLFAHYRLPEALFDDEFGKNSFASNVFGFDFVLSKVWSSFLP
ncbi:hypothetical protein CDAR_169311 [Caerostris darwini]|uniref:Uncharacterized protein n=1 Tax=Caerostris darwini TaxID=1538125 RepID=A0AAV4QKG5_9ARAC|nr:hypothetical protein CDAR_169311 [Caerostris darwini]